MEIKSILNKPYLENERLNFIIENNHKKGFEIRETDTALEAWGKTEEEKEAEGKEQQIEKLKKQLEELDLKAMRPIRAIIAGTSVIADTEKIEQLEIHAQEIRSQITELLNGN